MQRNVRLWVVAVALAGLALGCGTKKVTVDASLTLPEGVASTNLQLVTFYDLPSYKIVMRDRGRIGKVDIGLNPATTDGLRPDSITGLPLITPVQLFSPGQIRGMVFNRTAAEGMEIFRTESNGAVRRIFDFAIQVERRWIDGLSEFYQFADPDPRRAPNATYYSRGLIGGVAGAASPISNASRPAPGSITNIRYLATRWGTAAGRPRSEADSLLVMQWTPVPGAARYLLHVFENQTRVLSLRDRILSGAPSPILTIGARDIFIASVPASITSYKMGDPGATIYTFRTPRLSTEYFVRISAVDANGQLIGMNVGPTITATSDLQALYWDCHTGLWDYIVEFNDPEFAGKNPPSYLLFSRGATRVFPTKTDPLPCPGD